MRITRSLMAAAVLVLSSTAALATPTTDEPSPAQFAELKKRMVGQLKQELSIRQQLMGCFEKSKNFAGLRQCHDTFRASQQAHRDKIKEQPMPAPPGRPPAPRPLPPGIPATGDVPPPPR